MLDKFGVVRLKMAGYQAKCFLIGGCYFLNGWLITDVHYLKISEITNVLFF